MRLFFCFIFFTFSIVQTFAQTATVKPKSVTVEAGASFEIEYTFTNVGGGQFVPPNLTDFIVASGPNSFSSTNWVNGKTSSVRRFSYSLIPKKTGNLRLKGAGYRTGKQSFNSSDVPVKVTGKMPAPNMPNLGKTPKSGIAADDTLTAESLPDVFYVIEVDTNRVYVGQQLTAYYVLYSANSVTNYSSLSAPAQQAFWVEDISPNRINTETAVFGNKAFQKYAIKKFALFPQRSGTLEIDEMELEVQARFPLPNGQQRRFRNYTTKTLKVKADSKEVTVLPLPSGAPEDFKGTVGSYKLNVRANKTVCKVGEAIDLNVGILGNGNLKLIEPVQIPTSEDYEIYDPITSENIRADGDLVLGTKTYEYAIIPKKEGTIEIPSLRLTYFNPRTKRYEVKSSQKISVEVIPGDGSGIVELDVKEEKGIMEIKPGIDRLKSKSGSNLPLYVLGGLFLLPFLLMPMVVIRKKKADELKKDVVGNRRNQASTAAQHRLAEAKSYISRKDKKAFYTEITKTIEGYCADKFNMPASSLSKEVIVEQLQSKAIPENTIEELKNILEYCEVVLFAPVADADNLQKTYDATLSVVTELEEHF